MPETQETSTLTGNYARKQPPALPDGAVVEGINLSQAVAGTVLTNLAGVTVTFRNCNLVNVRIDKAWAVERCNVAQVVIPPEPTEKQRLIEERDRLVAQRAETLTTINDLNDQIDGMP